jgi:hypothetical protein
MQMKVSLILWFDAIGFDPRTSVLFSDQSTAAAAQYIRTNSERLTRHAALHYWLKARALEVLDDIGDLSISVLSLVE